MIHQIHQVRANFVKLLQEQFADYELTFSIGGQISFDILCVPSIQFPCVPCVSRTNILLYSPNGWDKTYALRHVESEFKEIHFFGDMTSKGGNDYEIYSDERTIGHTVLTSEETIRELKNLFDI